LAETTAALVQVFDAAGFEIILIETVGAGQAEVEIASLAHSTIVIEAPGLGDEIQTIKAGILEIADILVVNKSDQPGADNALRALKNMLTLSQPDHNLVSHHGEIMAVDQPEDQNNGAGWMIPVLPTVSTTGEGISDLLASIQSHYQYLQTSGEWAVREKKRLSNQLDKLLAAALRERWESSIAPEAYQEIITRVTAREISPRYAVENLIKGAGL
jgi:LAO/AO transport system kinase